MTLSAAVPSTSVIRDSVVVVWSIQVVRRFPVSTPYWSGGTSATGVAAMTRPDWYQVSVSVSHSVVPLAG